MRKVHGLIVLALLALLLAALVALDDTTGFGLIQHTGCASACKCVRSSEVRAMIGWPRRASRLTLASLRWGQYP
jgi:hypothetical protein